MLFLHQCATLVQASESLMDFHMRATAVVEMFSRELRQKIKYVGKKVAQGEKCKKTKKEITANHEWGATLYYS